jgi:hypothetical protein
MINSNIETMREGKVLPDHCQCGHLKDHHVDKLFERVDLITGNITREHRLVCQDYVFDTVANKMLQCGCKI